MARNFGRYKDIGIPPQSTGPRIHSLFIQAIDLTSIVGDVKDGISVTGLTSNATGFVVERNVIAGVTTVAVSINTNSISTSFAVGETLEFNGGGTAVANSVTDVYTNATALVGGNDPYNTMRIDETGAAYFRFAEGNQQLDAFGLTRQTTPELLDAFKFQYSGTNYHLDDQVTGNGAVNWLPEESSVVFAVTGATGDRVVRRSNAYYAYTPGVSRGLVMTVAHSDTGKAGNIRRWGFFDDNNGVFFELNGTQLSVVERSSVSGTPVDTVIPQSDWNGDRLDGNAGPNNLSIVELNLTNINIYWIDYQWLGAGAVRFGIYLPDGSRLPVHTIQNANHNPTVYSQTGSLPIAWENINTAPTAGTSEMKLACATVYTDAGRINPNVIQSKTYASPMLAVATTPTEILHFRTALTFNGRTNRIMSVPTTATFIALDAPILLQVIKRGAITGATWSQAHPLSPVEVATDGTVAGGWPVASVFITAGHSEIIDVAALDLHINAAGDESFTYSFVATALGGSPGQLGASVSWTDLG